MHCGMSSSGRGLQPEDESSIPKLWRSQLCPDIAKYPRMIKSQQVRQDGAKNPMGAWSWESVEGPSPLVLMMISWHLPVWQTAPSEAPAGLLILGWPLLLAACHPG